MEKIKEHRHCQICKSAIEEPHYGYIFHPNVYTYYKLKVCEACIIQKGIEFFEKQIQKEKK